MSSSALVGHAASLLRRGVIGGTSCCSLRGGDRAHRAPDAAVVQVAFAPAARQPPPLLTRLLSRSECVFMASARCASISPYVRQVFTGRWDPIGARLSQIRRLLSLCLSRAFTSSCALTSAILSEELRSFWFECFSSSACIEFRRASILLLSSAFRN